MLKIWLTWLQPSLGIVGAALLLSEPFTAYAATKSTAQPAKKATAPTTQSQWTSVRANGTRIDSELASTMAVTPDLAIRQIAVGTLNTGNIQAPNPALSAALAQPKANATKLKSLSSFAAPKTKSVRARKSNSTVAAALAQALQPSAAVPVPGLYIGNSDVKVAQTALPAAKPLERAIASSEIGAPTPLSSMMGQKITAADPFPVVRPEMMQKIQGNSAVAKATPAQNAPKSLDPIATMPTGTVARPTVTKTPDQIKASAPNSLDPIAAIPTGLQQVLGNNLDTTIGTATVAKKSAPVANSTMAALGHIITPDANPLATTVVSKGSLQLSTAQAYNVSTPKFNIIGETAVTARAQEPIVQPPTFYIPGEKVVASAPAKPTKNVLVAKTVREQFAPNQTRSSYTVANNSVINAARSTWLDADTRSNLGGLILGGQQPAAPQRVVAMPGSIGRTGNGLPARNLANFQ